MQHDTSLRTVLVLSIASIGLTACAAGLVPADRDTAPRTTSVQLRFDHPSDAAAVFPKAIEPALPSVDRIQHQVRARLGDSASAEVDLCVSPAGHVTKVSLARSSNLAAFDSAVLRDAETWQFDAMPGPAALQTCSRAIVSYKPHI